MRNLCLLSVFLLLTLASAARGQTTAPNADAAAIRQTALDYIEGWYEGDAARMERSLHPELAKRLVKTDAKGASTLEPMGALTLVQPTRKTWGKATPVERRQKDVTILDVFEGAATVKLVAADWIDYLHLARWN